MFQSPRQVYTWAGVVIHSPLSRADTWYACGRKDTCMCMYTHAHVRTRTQFKDKGNSKQPLIILHATAKASTSPDYTCLQTCQSLGADRLLTEESSLRDCQVLKHGAR